MIVESLGTVQCTRSHSNGMSCTYGKGKYKYRSYGKQVYTHYKKGTTSKKTLVLACTLGLFSNLCIIEKKKKNKITINTIYTWSEIDL